MAEDEIRERLTELRVQFAKFQATIEADMIAMKNTIAEHVAAHNNQRGENRVLIRGLVFAAFGSFLTVAAKATGWL